MKPHDPATTPPEPGPGPQAAAADKDTPPPIPPAAGHSWRSLESGRRRKVLALIALPLLGLGLLPLLWNGPAGPEELRQAERSLASGGAVGNNATATAVAGSLGDTMANLRRNFFTGGGSPDTSDPFPTHVWLSEGDDNAVVLVRIPEWRHFDDDARDGLADMAWMSAVLVLQQQGRLPQRLTVAVRGGWGFDRGLDGRPAEGDALAEVEQRSSGNRATRRLLSQRYTTPHQLAH